jgi:tRNA (guanine-N7-)-methyltransferase
MVRQHVNPLSRFFQLPLQLPPPQALFADPSLPLHLDIGCARGRFLLAMAQQDPGRNHLGVEIRRALVAAAEADRQALGLGNLHYLFCNANVSLQDWLAALPPGQLARVTIQFPDPWFKKKHHKRRVLQPPLLLAIAAALQPGQQLFLQSDVLAVIEPMVALSEASGCFSRPAGDSRPWRQDNPLPVPTERETYVLEQGLPVYRVLYERNEAPLPSLQTLEEWQQAADNPPTDPAPTPAA